MRQQVQPLTPAALYARVSSDRQDVDLSVAAQLRALRDFAKANGYTIAREYVDEAESGRIADRPQFRQMIDEGGKATAPFQVILVWKFSRFTRKRGHAVAFKSKLFAMRLKHVGFRMPEEQYDRIEPVMRKASSKLLDALEREGRKLIEEIYGTEPTEIYHQIRWVTNLITNTEVLELLRYHLTGRNSSTSTFPHPHEHCINSILETGKVELFKKFMEEGEGLQ